MTTGPPLHAPWYRIPVLWVAALALLGALVGCVITVGVALRYADTALAAVAPASRFSLPTDRSESQRP